jgi:oligosaccharyltransferase complex subunit beta
MHPFGAEFGLTLPPPETPLMSHFPPRSGPLTTLEIPVSSDSKVLSGGLSPIVYSGINFALGTNPMLFPIVNAPAESFATDTTKDDEAEILVEVTNKGGEGLWAGSSMAVVAGFQSKSGARVVWTGSVDMFSNEYMGQKVSSGKKSGNEMVVRDLSKWAFQESMVLRVDKVEHHRVGESEPREQYTIEDEVVRIPLLK